MYNLYNKKPILHINKIGFLLWRILSNKIKVIKIIDKRKTYKL